MSKERETEPGVDAEPTAQTPFQSRYRPENTREDGSYQVGKARPPEHSRFRAGDGRVRGRRPKSQNNFETDLLEEARRRVPMRENGKERRVTKQKALILRSFDSGIKGDHRASTLLFGHLARASGLNAVSQSGLPSDDADELNAWLRDRIELLEACEDVDVRADSAEAQQSKEQRP